MSAATATKLKAECRPGKRAFREYWIPEGWKDWQACLYFFGITDYGEEKLVWFKRLVEELWPEPVFIWDEWAELFFAACSGAKETVERLTGEKIDTDEQWWRRIMCTGAGSTGKTVKSALWCLCCWLYAQRHSTVVLTSTGMEQLKRRIWNGLLKWISASKHPLPLEPLPGDCEIRWAAGDKLSCIFGIPVKTGGEESESVDRIKGLHNTETYLVIDEMTSMPDAITEAERNLRKGTKRHQTFGLGNAFDMLDLHGRNMEPVDGWGSITVESVFWLNKLGGCSLHFDGHKSPRLRDDAKFHYYIGAEDIRLEKKFNGGESNPRYWSEVRGFWPPSGLSTSVMDAALLAQFNTSADAIWKSGWQMGGCFDAAFEGGDRRILYPFRWGEFSNGITGIEYLPPIVVAVDMTQDKRWIHYQIADAVQAHCEGYKVNGKPAPILPENFIMDVTGEGGGLFSVMSGRWSPKIIACEFGGAAEKTQISPDRPTTWHELYGNRVTMLWYSLRRFIEGDQVRGLKDEGTRTELTSRDKMMKAGKTHVRPKREMKLAKNRSPDKADACVLGAEFLRLRGVVPAGNTGGGVMLDATAWNRFADKTIIESDETDFADSSDDLAL